MFTNIYAEAKFIDIKGKNISTLQDEGIADPV